MKRGYWRLIINEVDEGFVHDDHDLKHIAECVKEGFTEGELWNDGETWFDCDREGHEEGCYMTRDESGDVKYRDCDVKEETSTN